MAPPGADTIRQTHIHIHAFLTSQGLHHAAKALTMELSARTSGLGGEIEAASTMCSGLEVPAMVQAKIEVTANQRQKIKAANTSASNASTSTTFISSEEMARRARRQARKDQKRGVSGGKASQPQEPTSSSSSSSSEDEAPKPPSTTGEKPVDEMKEESVDPRSGLTDSSSDSSDEDGCRRVVRLRLRLELELGQLVYSCCYPSSLQARRDRHRHRESSSGTEEVT
ncbi:hypothetical protein RQP46_010750 [Phenoliferia psychrophenolica]